MQIQNALREANNRGRSQIQTFVNRMRDEDQNVEMYERCTSKISEKENMLHIQGHDHTLI